MKKPTFVPSADHLESRIALSHGPLFIHGAAVLTTRALNKAYNLIDSAFVQFARHGQNYARLEANLARAVNPIPFNHRDGLLSAVESEVAGMQTDIVTKDSPTPVKDAMQRARADLHDFVVSEISSGVIVMR
jgi:hypothetical protein